jgi:hypothetical protein
MNPRHIRNFTFFSCRFVYDTKCASQIIMSQDFLSVVPENNANLTLIPKLQKKLQKFPLLKLINRNVKILWNFHRLTNVCKAHKCTL